MPSANKNLYSVRKLQTFINDIATKLRDASAAQAEDFPFSQEAYLTIKMNVKSITKILTGYIKKAKALPDAAEKA